MVEELKTENFEIEIKNQAPKPITEGHKVIYFKLIEPITDEVVTKLLGINFETIPKDMLDEARDKIYSGVLRVNKFASSMYNDRVHNQVVDTHKRPHKKYDSKYFRERMADSWEDCIESLIQEPSSGAGCPIFKVFYTISKAQYEKEMADVKKSRAKKAEKAVAYYKAVAEMNPDLEKMPDLDKLKNMHLGTTKTTGEFARQDPDLPESVFTEEEKRETVRAVRSRLRAAQR